MFDQVFVAEARSSKRFWGTCIGVTGQVALVAAMILAPMVWPEALPRPSALLTILLPPVPAPPPPKSADIPQVTRTVSHRAFVDPSGRITQPVKPPNTIDMTPDDPPIPSGPFVPGGVPNGAMNGVQNSLLSSLALVGSIALAPPRPLDPPRPAATATPTAPIRIKQGGVVQEGRLINRVEPQYPPLAKQMRVQGVVELMAIVGVDGRIKELTILSGHPLLTRAAADAVRRWVYKPTYLNSDPVEVMAPVTVTFRLN